MWGSLLQRIDIEISHGCHYVADSNGYRGLTFGLSKVKGQVHCQSFFQVLVATEKSVWKRIRVAYKKIELFLGNLKKCFQYGRVCNFLSLKKNQSSSLT